jgi:ribosomal protein S27AE
MIDHIINMTRAQHQNNRQRVKKYYYQKKSESVDSKLSFCTECNQVWEYEYFKPKDASRRKVLHYKDFPKIGKERKICPRCKKRNGTG